jgi:hypothetical protein
LQQPLGLTWIVSADCPGEGRQRPGHMPGGLVAEGQFQAALGEGKRPLELSRQRV